MTRRPPRPPSLSHPLKVFPSPLCEHFVKKAACVTYFTRERAVSVYSELSIT